MKYKLDVARDVDVDGYGDEVSYLLNLPDGFRFYDDMVHIRGFDTMAELRQSAKNDTIPCTCSSCIKN